MQYGNKQHQNTTYRQWQYRNSPYRIFRVMTGFALGVLLFSACNKVNHSVLTVVSTYAGDGKSGYADGSSLSAEFGSPTGVASDAQGNVYIADRSNNRIRRVANGVVSTFAGDGVPGYKDGNGTAAEFFGPTGVACDASGNVYVADELNGLVRKITPAGDVTTIAGVPGAILFKFHPIFYPYALACDLRGNIYAADKANNTIWKIAASGALTSFSTVLQHPSSLACDIKGNLYAANNGIQVYEILSATTTVPMPSDTTNFFKLASALTLDASGNIYVADNGLDRIKKISPSGAVNTVAGNGTAGYVDGLSLHAEFSGPNALTTDPKGNILVADTSNRVIRKITF